MTIVPLDCGPRATLLELDATLDPASLARWLRLQHPWEDVVPAARTVLVVGEPAALAELSALVEQFPGGVIGDPKIAAVVEIPTVYDGEDLAAVADLAGLTTTEVIAMHTATTHRAAFCGFAPGFAYLVGVDSRLHVPRLAAPRARVPAGAVALAAGYSAVYPNASPGGWRVIGRTTRAVWDPNRPNPALIEPGAHVRFVPTTAAAGKAR